jgi:hypothetical protein
LRPLRKSRPSVRGSGLLGIGDVWLVLAHAREDASVDHHHLYPSTEITLISVLVTLISVIYMIEYLKYSVRDR